MLVQKNKVNPEIRVPLKFYPKFASMILRFVFRGRILPNTSSVVIFTDRIPIQQRRRAVEVALKRACRADLPDGMRFDIYHHPKESNNWIQVADYCSWSVFRKWENRDDRAYWQLHPRLVAQELDVLARGVTRYY